MQILNYIASILAGIAVVIPVAVKLVQYVKISIKEKNWPGMLEMVMGYMKVAEGKFDTGAEKKEWVLAMIKASADTVNYDVDLDVVGKMIDDICDAAKTINRPAEQKGKVVA